MYLFKLLIFFACIYCVFGRNSAKALTESMGQEVIEIGAPIRELPPGLEEEPAAEPDDDSSDEEKTTTSLAPATKKDMKKTTKATLIDKPDTANQLNQEDEESRIEKELSEIYKDTDYKSDMTESPDDGGLIKDESQVLRQKPKSNFKFYPDSTSKAEIERFRTSVDELNCDKGVTQRLSSEINEGYQLSIDCIWTFGLSISSILLCF